VTNEAFHSSTARLSAVSIVIITVAVGVDYAWRNRVGRYQIARLDSTFFVVLDTTSGVHTLYRGRVLAGRVVFTPED